MQFKYDDHNLFLTTDNHFDIRFSFLNGKLVEIEIDDIMALATDDALHGLFVSVGGKIHSIYALSLTASVYYDGLVAEANQHAKEWDAHCRSFNQ